MEYTINTKEQSINFSPSIVEEIIQNIRMILLTPAYSCPMDRDFAWIPDMIDEPNVIVQAQIRGRLAEAIQKYEPRATVKSIEFETDGINGILKPVVRVMIDETAI